MESKLSVIKTLWGFWRQKWEGLLLLFMGMGIFLLVLFLNGIPFLDYAYGLLLLLVISCIGYGAAFSSYYKRQQYLYQNFESISGGICGFLRPADTMEEIYQDIVKEMQSKKGTLADEYAVAKRDMSDYYTMWMHQVKTPIAAMSLLLQEEEVTEKEVLELRGELFKIEEYAEMVMTYIRTEEGESDYVIKRYSLDELVKAALRKYASVFIRKKINVELGELNAMVLTDEKWSVFVIGQILSNALKYTSQGCVSIYQRGEWELVIEDTGIGIAPEDLPRIFQKGYTGYNGRLERKSTGIGLYISRRILNRLGHKIHAESKMGEGTKVYIDYTTWKEY